MPAMDIILWCIALAVLLAVVWIVLVSSKNGISPMPTSKAVRSVVTEEVNRVSGYGNIVEAGSGWGTLGIDVVRSCSGRRLTGIENSSIPLWYSQLFACFLSAARSGGNLRSRVRFIRGDIYQSSYRDADMVLCYLFPGAMERLAEKFKKELPPGAVLISICFALPGQHPVRTITCGDALRTKVYVYSF